MKASRRRRPARFIKFFLLLLLAAAAGAGWLAFRLTQRVAHNAAAETISIPPGTGPNAIINRLSEAGIVRHPTVLKLFLRITGRSSRLKAGDYQFESPISTLEAIDKIERGEAEVERVTIPEGLDRFEICELLASKTGKATAKEFLLQTYGTEPIEKIDPLSTPTNLEGYLFPDTYNYTSRTTAEDLIRSMAQRFNEVFTARMAARASSLGMSVREVVTLASIIEKETSVPDERPRIASVFMNRLRIGMPLASDPTFIYAAKLAGDWDGNPNQPRHRQRQSRYNTYLSQGLPPGPIASPGRASLDAALNPEDTKYLYFVASRVPGRHTFSRTAEEHAAAVQVYRQWQQEQRGQREHGGR